MGLWDRIGKKPAPSASTPPAAPPPARRTESEAFELVRLRRLGEPDGPSADEATALFRALRASADEARAIDVARTLGRSRPLPEPLRVAVAAALVDRGAPSDALSLLTSAPAAQSPEARMLGAEILAARGELAEAVALVERVLVVSFDFPGARERHTRWRSLLGLDAPRPTGADPSAATLVTREPDSPFLLMREIARGGSGAVYEAEDCELGRRVALKVYHHPERDRAQLLHEARVAAALSGPGIVRVLDVDPEHGWLALEWAPLGSLRARLRAKDTSGLSSVARWAVPLASAIARVHAGGWVHHDVKPANVLLADLDNPVLADFGTARKLGEPSPPGSLGYVSPERLTGRASDPRDDVFGFGRVIEDALSLVDPSATQRTTAAWRAIAAACTGADDGRPSDGRALLTRLRVEASHSV